MNRTKNTIEGERCQVQRGQEVQYLNNKSSEKREERKLRGENLSHEQLKKIGGNLEENYCQVKSFHQAPIIMNFKKRKKKKKTRGAKKRHIQARHHKISKQQIKEYSRRSRKENTICISRIRRHRLLTFQQQHWKLKE